MMWSSGDEVIECDMGDTKPKWCDSLQQYIYSKHSLVSESVWRNAIVLYAIGALFESLSEPVAILSQNLLFVGLTASVEGCQCRCDSIWCINLITPLLLSFSYQLTIRRCFVDAMPRIVLLRGLLRTGSNVCGLCPAGLRTRLVHRLLRLLCPFDIYQQKVSDRDCEPVSTTTNGNDHQTGR